MKRKLLINLRKRREKMYEFYYMVYGQMIKRRRLELNLTQEYVARAICSNTYVSKAENNNVVIGEDQLYQIMEKLDIPSSEFAKPETLIYYLEKIIKLFYNRDIEGYKNIVDKVDDYQFHVIVEIIKLGYLILNKDYEKAKRISDQLLDYLNSMDDYAFSIYLIFAAYLHLKLNNIRIVNYLIDTMEIIQIKHEELINMYLYLKYINHGKSHLLVEAEKAYGNLVFKLMNSNNFLLLKEVMVWRMLFSEYNKENKDIHSIEELIRDVDAELVDEFLTVRAINTYNPEKYIKYMKNKESENYLITLYFCARQAMENQDNELMKKYKKEISDIHYKVDSNIDYNNLLDLQKKDNVSFYKEYLINPCFRTAKEKENIFLMSNITEKIVETLKSRNRYKDALSYKEKLTCDIKNIQSI